MNHPITTTLSDQIYRFLKSEAKNQKTTLKNILEKALNNYKKLKLEERIKQGLQERKEEYQGINDEFIEAQANSLGAY